MLTIAVSLQYPCEVLDPLIFAWHEMSPLFDVKIDLECMEISFDHPFEDDELKLTNRTTLRSIIEGWLKDFFPMTTVMVRLCFNTGEYLNEITEHF